jgi:hypothetical protein
MIDNLAALGLVMALWFGLVLAATIALIRSGRVVPAPWDANSRRQPKRKVETTTPHEPR